ncbi:metastasis associated protein MTA1 [Echinococcus multilocularis]|uniref:Metastasis associated protein MTA1 n=1 Tax=Echinococcus multilocularis TaxID=6211 RepID=A0A068Y0R3_ECHMU|nr:metastasis associated protein MTA1 [Echinococcus multilocularis]
MPRSRGVNVGFRNAHPSGDAAHAHELVKLGLTRYRVIWQKPRLLNSSRLWKMSSSNKYRVGDFVYFETNATAPYQIRRLDELVMTPNGVEAKVTCYFRRRDISNTLIQQAEKYYFQETDDFSGETTPPLSDLQRHQVKHRELFHSRTIESLPATHIRGKCTVTLYNEVEPLTSYVEREDAFYYRLIYDPNTKRLQEDRGSMRIGSDFQCDIQPLLAKGEGDPRFKQNLEEILWNPLNSPSLSEMDTFISAVKAVGLYGRACDPASSLQNPLLINAAAAASRDVTLQFAHDILFRAGFDVQKAMTHLLPNGHPVVCKDELEMWTAHESSMFEEALGKQVKDFTHILTDSLPWKSSKSIVEMYYFWKTTDRYTRHRKNKMATKEQKLKQVYIPDYSKPNSSVLYNRTDVNDRGCECCYVETSPQWYAWGPPNLMCRLCSGCWTYWKKYGGLKNPDKRGAPVNSRPSPEQRVQDRLEARKSAAAAAAASTNSSSSIEGSGVSHQKAPPLHPYSDISLAPTVYRCNQPDCVKEFRSKENFAIHLAQVHSVTLISDGSSNIPVALAAAAGVFQHGAGTQGILTPPSIRIVRTLCPLLLRPAILARRPTKLANSTAQQRSPSEPIIPTDDLMARLGNLAKSRIPALRDPQAVLKRKLPVRSLKSVVKKLLLRLGRNDDSAIISAPFKRSFDSASIAQNGDAANGVEQPAEKRPRIEAVAQNCSSTNGRVGFFHFSPPLSPPSTSRSLCTCSLYMFVPTLVLSLLPSSLFGSLGERRLQLSTNWYSSVLSPHPRD